MDLQMRQANDASINETHHLEVAYRPGMVGDKEGIYTASTPTDCNFVAMRPGEIRRFAMYSIHGTATGRQGTVAQTSRIDDPGKDSGYIRAELTRKASGATLSFKIRAVPPGNAEEHIGICAAQAWQPFPAQFDLTNTDLANVDGIHKTLSLRMPNGENGCTGTGTAIAALSPELNRLEVTSADRACPLSRTLFFLRALADPAGNCR
jgi:hypothetical protein